MALTGSLTPDITEGLPGALGSSGVASSAAPGGYDVTFGSLGYNLAISLEHPYERAGEQMRKQQIDTSDEAGEQTFGSWWTRSWDSWDLGAGVRWYEPRTDQDTNDRFYQSLGVDVWEPGEISLLKRTVAQPAITGSGGWVCTFDSTAGVGYVDFRGETARLFGSAGTVTAVATTGTSGTTFTQPVALGPKVMAGSNNGVWLFNPAGPTLTKVLTSTGTARVWSVKHRLIVALDNSLYEVPYGYTPGAALTSAGALAFTHALTDWVWTDVVETSTAILAAGYSGSESAIFRFTMEQDDVTGDPILSSAQQVGRMPPGELIYCMGLYLGTSLVLGTSKGARVGAANPAGDIDYGLLTIATRNPVQDVTFRDRFAYVTLTAEFPDGGSGAARIDLSAGIGETGRFAWANDARLPAVSAAAVNSIALLGDRVVLTSGATGHHLQSSTLYELDGWLDTGRVRFGTAEQKAFRLARLVANVNNGRVRLTTIDPAGTEWAIVNFAATFSTDNAVALTIPQRPLNQFLSFRVYLQPTDVGTTTPTVSGLVVKAMPAAAKQRLFRYPLTVAPQSQDRQGNTVRMDPASAVRALETLEDSGEPVTVTDHRIGESYVGQIDAVEFSSYTPPVQAESGYAGVATVTVRRLD